LISDIAVFTSFVFLVLIFIISTYFYALIPKKGKKEHTTELTESNHKKISVVKNILIILIIILLISKLIVLFITPDIILSYHSISPIEINYILINIFYSVLWIVLLLFILIANEIKVEYLLPYYKRFSFLTMILFFLDIIVTGIVFSLKTIFYFKFTLMSPPGHIIQPESNFIIVLGIISLLLIITTILYFGFIIKRKLSILRYYEFLLLLLIAAEGYLLVTSNSNLLGWQESQYFRMKLFSYEYGYFALIYLALIAVTIVANSFVILLFNSREMFKNTQMIQNRIVNFMKIGFVAVLALSGVTIFPYFYIWIY